MMRIRKSPIAGSWYPGSVAALSQAIDHHVAAADQLDQEFAGELVGLICPHAGLMYSGPVAAYAYRLLRDRRFDVAVLVGPSHFVPFEGVSVVPSGGFETPLGVASIDADCADALAQAAPIVHDYEPAHRREHSVEMQIPFLQRLAPGTPIVPLVMGHQTADTARTLGDALAGVLAGRRALAIASTDLSHYHDAATAGRLDGVVIDHVSKFDAEGLQAALDRQPDHACGGGPAVAVMRAARRLGARDAVVLKYADSGDVTGDKTAVVGYLAAALGTRRAG
jgi:MEMO1 family protein